MSVQRTHGEASKTPANSQKIAKSHKEKGNKGETRMVEGGQRVSVRWWRRWQELAARQCARQHGEDRWCG